MDKDECNDEKTETCIAKKVDNNQQEDEHEDENCSPFCACMCCGQVVTNLFSSFSAESNKKYGSSKNTSSLKNRFHSSSYLDRIWQPPRLS